VDLRVAGRRIDAEHDPGIGHCVATLSGHARWGRRPPAWPGNATRGCRENAHGHATPP
jgi:hypothetical protein